MDADRTIGRQIRSRRIDRGLTREALAAELGLDVSELAAWERDESLPGASAGRELAQALGTDELDLGLPVHPGEGAGAWSGLPTEAIVVPGTAAAGSPVAAVIDDPPMPPMVGDDPTLAVPPGGDREEEMVRFPVVRRVLPPSLRRLVPSPSDYRESERRTYWMRFTLTAVALFVMFVVFAWATGEFLDALGKAFGSISNQGAATTTTVASQLGAFPP